MTPSLQTRLARAVVGEQACDDAAAALLRVAEGDAGRSVYADAAQLEGGLAGFWRRVAKRARRADGSRKFEVLSEDPHRRATGRAGSRPARPFLVTMVAKVVCASATNLGHSRSAVERKSRVRAGCPELTVGFSMGFWQMAQSMWRQLSPVGLVDADSSSDRAAAAAAGCLVCLGELAGLT